MCLTLCDPVDCSPARLLCPRDSPGRILDWVAFPFSKGSFRPRKWTQVSCIRGRFLYCLNHRKALPVIYICCQVTSVVSDSVRPHRRQPTRLPRPWDSPAKNTGVGHHFLLQCTKVKSQSEVVQSCPTLSDPMDCSLPGSSVHGIFQARVLEWGAIAFSHIHIYTHTHISPPSPPPIPPL